MTAPRRKASGHGWLWAVGVLMALLPLLPVAGVAAGAAKRPVARLSWFEATRVRAAGVHLTPAHPLAGLPRTPAGLPRCTHALRPVASLPHATGETIRYYVNIDGLSVGTVDFKIQRHGSFEGRPVTEYRSQFQLDSLVSTFVPVAGRAAALVPDGSFTPTRAMSRYHIEGNVYEESMRYGAGGHVVSVTQSKNGKSQAVRRRFAAPIGDFVSAFYMLRSLPRNADGCTLIYGNARAYTVWIEPDGQESVHTPVGLRPADRYVVRYGSERSKHPYFARVWLSQGPDRLPYRAQIRGRETLDATIHLYETGQ